MGIIKYKPTSAGRRSMETADNSDITTNRPEWLRQQLTAAVP